MLRITEDKTNKQKILSYCYVDSIWDKHGDILLSQKNRNGLAEQKFQSLGYGSYFTLGGGKGEAKAEEVRQKRSKDFNSVSSLTSIKYCHFHENVSSFFVT